MATLIVVVRRLPPAHQDSYGLGGVPSSQIAGQLPQLEAAGEGAKAIAAAMQKRQPRFGD
jgi:hypothetical protein